MVQWECTRYRRDIALDSVLLVNMGRSYGMHVIDNQYPGNTAGDGVSFICKRFGGDPIGCTKVWITQRHGCANIRPTEYNRVFTLVLYYATSAVTKYLISSVYPSYTQCCKAHALLLPSIVSLSCKRSKLSLSKRNKENCAYQNQQLCFCYPESSFSTRNGLQLFMGLA